MTQSGYVLNVEQSTYARKVEAILKSIDEAPFPAPYVVYAHSAGMTPQECVTRGMQLAVDA